MNVKNSTKNKRGFTIIEVVLVLAIAGLIFLMVFIALPALQRSQRDTQRRDDYGMLSAAVTSYAASNGGKITNLTATTGCKSLNASKYINDTGEDPDGVRYNLKGCTYAQFAATAGNFKPTTATAKATTVNTDGLVTAGGADVFIVVGADCSSTTGGGKSYEYNVPTENSSRRAFAIFGYLESGSQTYCSASQ